MTDPYTPTTEEVLERCGVASVPDTLRYLSEIDEDNYDREMVAYTLWTMGGSIKHKKCTVQNEGNYENVCEVCETYLLAVADSIILIRDQTAHDATVRAEGAAEMRERAAKDVEEAARVLEIGAILIRPNKATAELIEAFRAAFQRTANSIRALPPLSPQPDTTTGDPQPWRHEDGMTRATENYDGHFIWSPRPEFGAVPEPTGDEQ